MNRIIQIIKSQNFNFELTNLLIDIKDKTYKNLDLSLDKVNLNDKEIHRRLTHLAAIIDYTFNHFNYTDKPEWVNDERLVLEEEFTNRIPKDSEAFKRRKAKAPNEFKKRKVYYDPDTIIPW